MYLEHVSVKFSFRKRVVIVSFGVYRLQAVDLHGIAIFIVICIGRALLHTTTLKRKLEIGAKHFD